VVALSFCRLLGLGCPKQAFAKIATPRRPEQVTILALSTLIVGCSLQGFEQTSRYAETKFTLDSANFETETVHAVGTGRRFGMPFILSTPTLSSQLLLA
jgi:hypothetical protein